MADKKISELPTTTSIGNDDIVPIVQSNNTKKITWSNIIAGIKTALKTTATTGSLTYNSTYITSIDARSYVRTGNVVQVSFRGKLANSIPNNTVIITLPYKSAIPFNCTAFIGGQYTKDSAKFVSVSLGSKDVKISTYSGSNQYIHIDFTYVTNEN